MCKNQELCWHLEVIYYNALIVGNPIDCAILLNGSRYSNSSDFQPTEFLHIFLLVKPHTLTNGFLSSSSKMY